MTANCTVPWLEISIDGCRIWPIARKIRQKSLVEVSGLKIDGYMHPLPKIDGFMHPLPNIGYEISIDGCMIWPIARKIRQKSVEEVLGPKIDGCMHPFPRIDGCSCTRRTRTNQGPVMYRYI